jgi:malate dehydrogenase (oxaloacetate-decarboxylating)(NADP+)
VGLGIVVSGATLVTDRMFSEAAKSLAALTTQADLDMGRIYPSLKRIREISAHLAAAVAESAFKEGLASIERPANVLEYMKSQMWTPQYESYLG